MKCTSCLDQHLPPKLAITTTGGAHKAQSICLQCLQGQLCPKFIFHLELDCLVHSFFIIIFFLPTIPVRTGQYKDHNDFSNALKKYILLLNCVNSTMSNYLDADYNHNCGAHHPPGEFIGGCVTIIPQIHVEYYYYL